MRVEFPFTYDGNDYVLWAWKGDYLNLGAGAEMGIYDRLGSTDHYLVDTNLALPMTLTLVDNEGNTIVDYEAVHWWITGFNPYHQDVEAGNLIATYTIDFTGNEGMYEAFYSEYGQYESWSFEDDYTATFTFE